MSGTQQNQSSIDILKVNESDYITINLSGLNINIINKLCDALSSNTAATKFNLIGDYEGDDQDIKTLVAALTARTNLIVFRAPDYSLDSEKLLYLTDNIYKFNLISELNVRIDLSKTKQQDLERFITTINARGRNPVNIRVNFTTGEEQAYIYQPVIESAIEKLKLIPNSTLEVCSPLHDKPIRTSSIDLPPPPPLARRTRSPVIYHYPPAEEFAELYWSKVDTNKDQSEMLIGDARLAEITKRDLHQKEFENLINRAFGELVATPNWNNPPSTQHSILFGELLRNMRADIFNFEILSVITDATYDADPSIKRNNEKEFIRIFKESFANLTPNSSGPGNMRTGRA